MKLGINVKSDKSAMTYGEGAARQHLLLYLREISFWWFNPTVLTCTMTTSQCFDTSSSPDKCYGDEKGEDF